MAPAVVGAGFEALPSEVLLIITEKIYRECPLSFRALKQTSHNLRNAAKRCSKTLVLYPSKRYKHGLLLHQGKTLRGAVENAERPKEVLSEELSRCFQLSRLVIEKIWVKAKDKLCSSSVLDLLTRVPWREIEVDGLCLDEGGKKFRRTIWGEEFPKVLVSQSAASLKRLVLTGFDFEHTKNITSLLRNLPMLEDLKVGGMYVGGHSIVRSFAKHDCLKKLDIADLASRHYGLIIASADQHTVPRSAYITLNLPRLRHLTATVYRTISSDLEFRLRGGDHSRLLVDDPDFSFPDSLEVLELNWCYSRIQEIRPDSLYPMLARDCPRLQRLSFRIHTQETQDAKQRSLQWISEQDRIPDYLPELEEVNIEVEERRGNAKRGKWKCVKSIGRH